MAENETGQAIDLRQYGRIVLKRIWVLATVFAVVVVATVIGTVLQTPIYRATSTVLIELEAPNVVSFQDVIALGAGNYYDTRSYYETQFKIIRSRQVAAGVIQTLKLDRELPYSKAPDPIETLLGQVTVDPVKSSYLVGISADNADAARAADIANAFARIYIEENLAAKTKMSADALKWLRTEATSFRDKVQESEKALWEFRQENDIVSFEERQDIISQRIADLTTAYTDIRRKRIEAEVLYNRVKQQAKSASRSEAIPAVLANSLIQDLKGEEIRLERTRAELANKYGPKHPEMIKLDSELSMLKARMAGEIAKIVSGIETEFLVAQDRETAVEAELGELKQVKRDLDLKQIEYNALEREAETNKSLYEVLEQRTKETQITENIRANNVRIVDPAEVPRYTVRPRTKLNIALGVVLGLLGGLGLVFFFEYIDNTIKNQEDVESVVRLPFLGVIPSFKGDENEVASSDLFVHEFPKSSVTESCRVIRTNITYSSPDRRIKRLLITSASPQEGKSTAAVNLGIIFAQGDKKVLIVDTDMRRPRIHKAFGISSGRPGLTNLIMGESTMDEVIADTGIPGVSVIPCGPIPPQPAELLGARHMEELAAELDARFDWVIFDSPPVVAVTDAVVLSRMVDGVILVVKAGKTTRDLVLKAKRQLTDVGAPILGTVLNDFDMKAGGYRYYYYYHSYRSEDGENPKGRKKRRGKGPGESTHA